MKALAAVLGTSVGHKALVAASGLTFSIWCALHVLGNGAAFAGSTALDGYAAWLRSAHAVPLWGLRLALSAVVGTHVVLGVVLWRRARAARGQPYRQPRRAAASLASRAVRWCGLGLGAFIVFHVLHINYGFWLPGFVRGHVYRNMLLAFASPLMLGIYLLASLLVGVHLAHGIGAALQSLGGVPVSKATRRVSIALAVPFVLGFAAAPLAMSLGVLR